MVGLWQTTISRRNRHSTWYFVLRGGMQIFVKTLLARP
ncbi:uncharacterized protein J3R85_020316 [Psidium guajava]|nr:uncharacterized protein J3R85_020316 [Psidium guajava]